MRGGDIQTIYPFTYFLWEDAQCKCRFNLHHFFEICAEQSKKRLDSDLFANLTFIILAKLNCPDAPLPLYFCCFHLHNYCKFDLHLFCRYTLSDLTLTFSKFSLRHFSQFILTKAKNLQNLGGGRKNGTHFQKSSFF